MIEQTKPFSYTGCENLDAMKVAQNYNIYIAKFVTDSYESLGKESKILDFGAGSGIFADILKTDGINVECMELDSTLRRTLAKKGYIIQTDIKKCKGRYDIVYALNVLEHIDDDYGIVNDLKNALKPDGRLIIYVPAHQVLFSNMDEQVGHYRRYSRKRLHSITKKAGFKNVSISYCDPIGFFLTIGFILFGNKEGNISKRSIKAYDKWLFPVSNGLSVLTKNFFGKNLICLAKNDE